MIAHCFLVSAALLTFAVPAAADTDDIFGTWLRSDAAARVRMAPCGDAICAINVWIRDADKQDENVGDRLVFRIARKADAWHGTAYDPRRGLNLTATLKASGDRMETTGCALGGIICRTTQWTRSADGS